MISSFDGDCDVEESLRGIIVKNHKIDNRIGVMSWMLTSEAFVVYEDLDARTLLIMKRLRLSHSGWDLLKTSLK